ncbi:MAG: alpha/beta hydrolase [Lachnospiraceae bacterium]|nr:alpha/beta hydrolase [Lachnospiraceae bacterium]
MAEEKDFKDYRQMTDAELVADRIIKWEKMYEEYAAEGIHPIRLWEDGDFKVPHKKGFVPQMLLYPAHEGTPRGIVLVCAGGAFKFKSSNEAKPVAEFFYKNGLNAAVLDYCTDAERPMDDDGNQTQMAAAEDALRAIRLIRYHAKEWNINPDKIAIGGFSAGGMTSSRAATMFDYGNPDAEDPVERVSSRPDAALLIYSAFTTFSMGAGGGTDSYSFEKQNAAAQRRGVNVGLRFDCPPFFIMQTANDDPRGSMYLGIELANRGIPFEVHTFESGPHGGALYDGQDEDTPYYPHTAMWAPIAADWLKMHGFGEVHYQ